MIHPFANETFFGAFPLYWLPLVGQPVGVGQLLAHRIFWASLLAAAILCSPSSRRLLQQTLANKQTNHPVGARKIQSSARTGMAAGQTGNSGKHRKSKPLQKYAKPRQRCTVPNIIHYNECRLCNYIYTVSIYPRLPETMKAMILAAGRGERMRPLTDTLPKPMLPCGREPLIGWHLRRLAAADITDIIINHAWLGRKIEQGLGNGSRYGVSIRYSPETHGGLETAGGIATALPLLGQYPFLVINGDILTDFDCRTALRRAAELPAHTLAHLWLVPNPPHHPQGDFRLQTNGLLADHAPETADSPAAHTFSGIGLYRPELFADTPPHQPAKLAPLLRRAIRRGQVSGEMHTGLWIDVGTPERLQEAARLSRSW